MGCFEIMTEFSLVKEIQKGGHSIRTATVTQRHKRHLWEKASTVLEVF